MKILPKDPLVPRTQGLWPVDATVACVSPGDGPTSARVAIVDYNGDLDTRFAPAKLLKDGSGFHGIAGLQWLRRISGGVVEAIRGWRQCEQARSEPLSRAEQVL